MVPRKKADKEQRHDEPAPRTPAKRQEEQRGRRRPHPLRRLQRLVGNQFVQRLVNARSAQAQPDAPASEQTAGDATAVHAPSLRARLGGGRALDPELRRQAEAKLGPLGPVRLHTGAQAADVAEELDAQAFTLGRDVGFAHGALDPDRPAGRRLIIHELAHVKQAGDAPVPADGNVAVEAADDASERGARQAERQGAPAGLATGLPAALRLKKLDLFGLDWNAEHSDVAGGNAADQLLAVYRALTGADAGTAAAQIPALERLAGGNTALLLRAYDFIRDNLVLLPQGLLGDMLSKAARFCNGRSDSPTALSDDFYRELLIAILYTAAPGGLVIEHMSGSRHAVPGIAAGEADFGATSSPTTSLQRTAPPRAGRPITGGFDRPLSLTVGFGTMARYPYARVVADLIRDAGSKIDPKLVPAVNLVAQDKYILRALKKFLFEDGGKLVGWDNDSGRYDGKKPPTIFVGYAGGAFDTRTTLVHELLHYVFDKSDSVLAEARSSGGADHPAIEAIEAKFMIIDLIRSGKPPLHEKLRSKFGQFLKAEDLFPKMEQAIAADDRDALSKIVNSGAFVTTVVQSGLMPTASSLKFVSKGEGYDYTPEQFRDLAFLWAQNAAIVRRAMNEAVSIAGRKSIPLKDVFASEDWKQAMRSFLRAYVMALQRDPQQGVVALEKSL